MRPTAAARRSSRGSRLDSAVRSRVKYARSPSSVTSYSMRGGPPATLGVVSCTSSRPCPVMALSAWYTEPEVALDHSWAPQASRSARTW